MSPIVVLPTPRHELTSVSLVILDGFIRENYILRRSMPSNSTKVVGGAVLLLIGAALILGTGLQQIPLPAIAGSVAALLLAAGSVLLGTSEGGQPV
jgi:hypothetical protein